MPLDPFLDLSFFPLEKWTPWVPMGWLRKFFLLAPGWGVLERSRPPDVITLLSKWLYIRNGFGLSQSAPWAYPHKGAEGWVPLLPLGPIGSFWVPLGPLGSFGSPWVPLESLWGPPWGRPWVRLAPPLGLPKESAFGRQSLATAFISELASFHNNPLLEMASE